MTGKPYCTWKICKWRLRRVAGRKELQQDGEHKQTKTQSFLAQIATFLVHGGSHANAALFSQEESAWTSPPPTPSSSSTATSTLRTTCRLPPAATGLAKAGGYHCVCVRRGAVTTLCNSAKEVMGFFFPPLRLLFVGVASQHVLKRFPRKCAKKVWHTFSDKTVQPDGRCSAK